MNQKICLCFICFFLVVGFCVKAQNVQANIYKKKLNMAEYIISEMYVDSLSEPELVEYAIKKMLDKLDPHSTYLSAEETKKNADKMKGNYHGVGLSFKIKEDQVLVSDLVHKGPSAKAGLIVGDRIMKIDSVDLSNNILKQEDVVGLLRGPKGSSVKLLIGRRNNKKNIEFNINREEIPVKSIEASYLVQPKTGYIRLTRFAQTSYLEFKDALLSLKQQGMNDLILDLQGNSGGHFNSVIEMANDFLSTNELIVYAEGRAAKRQNFFAKDKGLFRKGKLVLLVDENSASCSEVLSAAVQDWDRGLVIGRRTFGKGLIQNVVNLPDKSQLRVTVSRYYTPSGRSIQKPYTKNTNNNTNLKNEYYSDLNKRMENGEMFNSDSIRFDESLKVYTKKLNRPVYGGGGVMPDLYVPYDTTINYLIMRKITEERILSKVAKDYLKQKGEKFDKSYKLFEQFNASFTSDPLLKRLLEKELDSIYSKHDNDDVEKIKPLIDIQIKAYIASEKWGRDKFIQVVNKLNNTLEKALDVLNSSKYDELLSSR